MQIDWNASDKYDAESPPATYRKEHLVDKRILDVAAVLALERMQA